MRIFIIIIIITLTNSCKSFKIEEISKNQFEKNRVNLYDIPIDSSFGIILKNDSIISLSSLKGEIILKNDSTYKYNYLGFVKVFNKYLLKVESYNEDIFLMIDKSTAKYLWLRRELCIYTNGFITYDPFPDGDSKRVLMTYLFNQTTKEFEEILNLFLYSAWIENMYIDTNDNIYIHTSIDGKNTKYYRVQNKLLIELSAIIK